MFTLVHAHLLLNHLPIIITGLGLVLLAFGMSRRDDSIARTGLVFFVGAALAALPTYLTGEPAEEAVEDLPGVVKSLIEEHQDAALIAALVVGALGLYSLWALWRYRGQPALPRLVSRVALVGALAGSGLMVWTGLLGGQIRHTEVRADTTTADVPAGGSVDRDSGR